MATAKIQGNPLGSGSVTLAAPNTNSDFTLTLPAENGSLLTSSGTQAAAFSTLAVAGNSVSTVNGNWRNRLINGAMQVAQRVTAVNGIGASTAVPTASTGYRNVDRFFIYLTSGTFINASQVAVGGGNILRITGGSGIQATGIGVGQRIEQRNSFDLAGSAATLSVDLATTAFQTVTWTVSYANTADTFGTIGTPTKTQIATGTFATTDVLTRYTATMDIPSAATTGIEVLLTVGSLGTNFQFNIGNMQFEAGSVATPFERRPIGTELMLCQRYYQRIDSGGNASFPLLPVWWTGAASGVASPRFSQTMRATPTFSSSSIEAWGPAGSQVLISTVTLLAANSILARLDVATTTSPYTAGQTSFLNSNAATGTGVLQFSAEL